MRVKRGVHHVKRRRNILKATKGYRWGRKTKIKAAQEAAKHAGKHAYAHRRTKKRVARRLWNVQINAGSRIEGMSYSRLISGLKKSKVELNRKMLAELSENHPEIFQKIVNKVK